MNYLILHIIVFVWGFTGILGDLIFIDAPQLVWYRMWMAGAVLMLWNILTRKNVLAIAKHWKSLLLASLFVVIHWVFFFGSIKASTVSIGVVCMSTQAFMISLIQPLIKKNRIKPHEAVLGLLVVAAMIIIFGFEYQYKVGILMGLTSSLFAVLFTIINARLTKEMEATVIAGWEMSLGAILLSVYLFFTDQLSMKLISLHTNDLSYLLLLSIVCTAVAFPVSVHVMRKLSAYIVSLSVNLEPVYTILLTLIPFFGGKNIMSSGFYAGTAILLATVLVEPILSRKYNLS
jgi:drug/metabolite transporter (DMT)-like permease